MFGRMVVETATHVFFQSGPLSQWYPSVFVASVEQGGATLSFNCAEQYMMASKAAAFADWDSFAKIMAVQATNGPFTEVPKQQKALGRSVRNFDQARWNDRSRGAVFRGNWAKFSQNAELGSFLLATGDKCVVEGSAKDRIWGVGLAWNDPAILDPGNWRGSNWLGEALIDVRRCLKTIAAEPDRPLDLWAR